MTQVIRTRLEVDATKAVAGFKQGEQAVHGYEKAVKGVTAAERGMSGSGGGLDRLTTSIHANRAAWDDLSSKAMLGGAVVAGGLGLATKAAIGWESAWAGVTKTTDGTPEQMAQLEEGLRGLAKELPATHEELAAVAEAAGQLGVAREDILGFTETAVALGESTNLTADEAATSLAKFSNVMGTTSREGVQGYERLGATLVALGNDGASTEADIMSMALRLSGAGKQIGATEADILALSNALSSVGIEAELGGGAMSRALLEMNSAVISGGEELDAFAEIAGVSASEFATAWRKDPIEATNLFVTGLGRIGESGGDAAAALDAVGLGGTQNAQVLLRAAGASDLVTESLKLGATAWEENAALAEEAGKRYATTESRLQIAKNTMRDAAIDAGSVIGPMFAAGAEKVAGLANAFVSLPEPVQSTITGVAGVTAGVGLLGGAAVKAVGATHDFRNRLDEIGMLTPKVERGLDGAAKAARGFATTLAISAAVGTVGSLLQDKGSAVGVEELTKNVLDADDAVAVFNNSIAANAAEMGYMQDNVSSFDDALRVAFNPDWMDSTSSGFDGVFKAISFGAADMQTTVDESNKTLTQLDTVLSGLVSQGRGDVAEELFGQFAAKANAAGVSTDELRSKLPLLTEAQAAAGNQAKLTGDDTAGLGDDVDALGADMDQAAEDAEELTKAIKGLGDATLGERGSAREYQAALDAVGKSIEENGHTLDISTEAGRANEAALDDLANSTQEWAAAVFTATGDVDKAQGILSQGRKRWMEYATALGIPKKEAKALADELFKLEGVDVAAKVKVDTTKASADTQELQRKIKDIDGQVAQAQVKETGSTEARSKVLDFTSTLFGLPKGKDVAVTEHGATPAKARVMAFNEMIRDTTGKTVTVTEAGSSWAAKGRVDQFRTSIAEVDGKWVTVTELGSTAAGGRVVQFKNKIYEVPPSRTVTIEANTGAALAALAGVQAAMNAIQPKTVTVTTQHRNVGLKAAGGIVGVEPMAAGGMRPGGSVRPGIYPTSTRGILMAEDTRSKWESYIPERPDLRGRAEAILAETARRFGKAVVPLDQITQMAAGGVWHHSAYYLRKQAEWEALRASGAEGGTSSGGLNGRTAEGGTSSGSLNGRGAFVRSPSKHLGRTYVTPAQSYGGASGRSSNSQVIARLHPQDAALIARVARRPVEIEIDGVKLARANSVANRRHGSARTGALNGG
ncbi:phage tail tape measure protein [Janibacter terrae]|uniref:phage tail tape measure protein n=1 Tax=Janibacter terrae TaxID=103817 RepID=UPI0008298B4C|nr:phage tail tape measure protein [Janibacter terrae]